jgi:enoyl-CoA hydratase
MADVVRVERDGAVAVVTLDRPPMNALDVPSCEELTRTFGELAADPTVRAVVLTGAGPAFSAGVDLQLVPELEAPAQDVLLAALNTMFLALYALPLPVVAAVDGHAIAGGLVLALCADHRVVGPKGKHGLTEVSVGVRFPAVALEAVRTELAEATVRRLVLDGELHASAAALALGLYDEQADDPVARAAEVAARRAAHAPEFYADLKAAVRGASIARMRAAAAADPLQGSWLSEATRDLARARLAR